MKISFSFLLLSCCVSVSFAAQIFVDNMKGDDANPGSQEQHFRTFAKSLSALQGGDTLNIVPNEEPYREEFGSLEKKHSGTPENPTVIDGHGATLTRLNHFPAERWTDEGNGVYSLRYKHNIVVMSGKGYYDGFPFIFVDGEPLSCVKSREALTDNTCFLFLYWDPETKSLHKDHSMLYIKLPQGKTPANTTIMMPEKNGVIVGGDYITVKNINSEWSSSDLFDTHRGKGIVFENITAQNCQDQCTSAHSTESCLIKNSFFRNALAMCALDITFTSKEYCFVEYDACVFERGGAGFQGSGEYVVENSILRDNTRNALMARGDAKLTVRNCTLVQGEDGHYGLGISANADVTLENCTFVGFKNAINILGPNARVTLKNCVFIDSEILYSFWRGAKPNQLLSENTQILGTPTITVEKEKFVGLDAFAEQYPGGTKSTDVYDRADLVTAGSNIPSDLTLVELATLVQSKL